MITTKRLREIVNGKLVDHTLETPYEDLSEEIFGEGNAFSATEVRKRLYGMKRYMEVEDLELATKTDPADAATLETTHPQFLFDEIEARRKELAKEKKRFQDQRREYNKLLASDARFEALADRVAEAAQNLNFKLPLKRTEDSYFNMDGSEAILVLADWHFGMTTENVWQKYNVEICRQRVAELVESVREKLIFHQPRRLHVLCLGDMCAGAIHVSARVASEELVCEQIMNVAELMAQAIAAVAEPVEETLVYYTYGNHLRTVQNKKDNIHRDNMERLIPWWLKLRLADYPSVQVVESDKFELVTFPVCGYTVCGTHGDLDGIKSAGKTLHTLFSKQYGENIDCVILADKHHHEEFEALGIDTIIVRALCGTDDYANNKRLYSAPGQTLIFFKPEYGRDATYHIRFDK